MTIGMRTDPTDPTEDVDTGVNISQLKKETRMYHQVLPDEYKPYQYKRKVTTGSSKTMDKIHCKPN
jgi:hypothetical protein